MELESRESLRQRKTAEADVLEAILEHVGEWGRYQKILFLLMAPFGIFFAFVYFVQMFIAIPPQKYWCRVPEVEHLSLELRQNLTIPGAALGGKWDMCATFDVNWTDVLQSMEAPGPGAPTVPCRYGWEYDYADILYPTVVTERDWVCDRASYAPTAQVVFFAGSFVGCIFLGWMADRFGRVPALVASNLLGAVGGIATIFTTGIWDFIFCRFIVGMAFDNCFMMMYILVLEYVGPKHRTYVANMSIALFFGSGCMVLPQLARWLADWRVLLWVTSLPMLLVLLVPIVVPESARWLLTRGKVHQTVKIMKRFEKINRTKIPQNVMDEFMMFSRQTKKSSDTIVTLLRSGPLRTAFGIMIFAYMACAVIFDALVRMSDHLGLDFFLTFTLTSATEIPSVTLLALVLDRLGRRFCTGGPIAVSGILIIIAIFVPKGIPLAALAIFARFFINMAYNAAIQWSTELLPTRVRALGSSTIHMSGCLATMLSPAIVYSEVWWETLPLIILGSLAVLASASALLLPETRGRDLPQTMADGEQLVIQYAFCGRGMAKEVSPPPSPTLKVREVST